MRREKIWTISTRRAGADRGTDGALGAAEDGLARLDASAVFSLFQALAIEQTKC